MGNSSKRGRPRSTPVARCPDRTHRGSTVVSRGTRESSTGTRRRYLCTPLSGIAHHFTVVVTADALMVSPVAQQPPPCPKHASGKVVRDGTYGSRSPVPRQRYRCYPNPADKSVFHSFVPPLARQHIHAAGERCDVCDEHRGVHRGEPAVARQHSWPARTVARGLDQLSRGASYADGKTGRACQIGVQTGTPHPASGAVTLHLG